MTVDRMVFKTNIYIFFLNEKKYQQQGKVRFSFEEEKG